MIAVLSASTGAVVVSSFSSDRKGKEFAQRIQSTLTRARWAAGSGPGNSNGSGRSLRIFASDPNLKSVSTLITAFNEAGLRYRVFRACQGTDLVLEIGESDLDKAPAIK